MTISKLLLALLSLTSTLVFAEEYDNIVADLKSSLREESVAPAATPTDPFESQQIELGAAISAAYIAPAVGKGVLMKGFDLHFGLDLFSPRWTAEGSYRSFGSEEATTHYSASLREFDLRIVHKYDLQKNVRVRMGAGVSARYLTSIDSRGGGHVEQTAKTPAFVAMLGLERELSPKFSVGPDFAYRTPVGSDTQEKSSADVNLRMNLHF